MTVGPFSSRIGLKSQGEKSWKVMFY